MREEKMGSQQILPNILKSDFPGLSGKVQFANRAIAPVYTFQIINVMEGSHIELGFSETMGESATLSSSMKDLARKVYWPGGARYTPLGWSPPTSANPLRIGLAIELFHGTLKELPFDLPYEVLPFNGTMNELAEQIYLKIKIHSKIIYFSNN
ncbi:hypothetical protein ACFX14_007862 [Malus domestica]